MRKEVANLKKSEVEYIGGSLEEGKEGGNGVVRLQPLPQKKRVGIVTHSAKFSFTWNRNSDRNNLPTLQIPRTVSEESLGTCSLQFERADNGVFLEKSPNS